MPSQHEISAKIKQFICAIRQYLENKTKISGLPYKEYCAENLQLNPDPNLDSQLLNPDPNLVSQLLNLKSDVIPPLLSSVKLSPRGSRRAKSMPSLRSKKKQIRKTRSLRSRKSQGSRRSKSTPSTIHRKPSLDSRVNSGELIPSDPVSMRTTHHRDQPNPTHYLPMKH